MRYKVTVSYDGHNYCGWQKQEGLNTVQFQIEKYLSKICNEEIEIVASGRTDRYVHALGQVFHFDTKLEMDTKKWVYALNNFLPEDIRILKFEVVDENFHARFSAKSKTYRYIFTKNIYSPFEYKYKMKIKENPDIELMKEASKYLIGTHDFTSFCSGKIHPLKSRVKTIYFIHIYEQGDDVVIEFNGSGFLRYMVRMLSQVLLEVGKKTITPIIVKEMLEQKDKEICRYKAEGSGLYLVEIQY